MGSKVRHAKYGVGTILECEDDGEDSKLTISFPGYGRKKNGGALCRVGKSLKTSLQFTSDS